MHVSIMMSKTSLGLQKAVTKMECSIKKGLKNNSHATFSSVVSLIHVLTKLDVLNLRVPVKKVTS